jgi:SAM-dependent methyltransferase
MLGFTVGASHLMKTTEEAEALYNDWAESYEVDLCQEGYRIPGHIATVFTRFVPIDASPILDAGCGGGHQAEALSLAGYRSIVGMDLSERMMDVARTKGIYQELQRAVMGETLDFEDNQFDAVLSSGCITPGHAPAHSFDELIRVCRPGGQIVFSLRDDSAMDPTYRAVLKRLENDKLWKSIFISDNFKSLPYSDSKTTHRIHVNEVL